MLLKLRDFNRTLPEASVSVPKNSLVSDLLKEASSFYDCECSHIELFYGGKKLLEELPLQDYSLGELSVVNCRIKQKDQIDTKKTSKAEEENDENNKDVLNDQLPTLCSNYFHPGDNLYFQTEKGQWEEGKVVSVMQCNNAVMDNEEEEDKLTYRILFTKKNEDLLLRLKNLLPCSPTEFRADQLKAGMKVLAFVAPPGQEEGWHEVDITTVSRARKFSHPSQVTVSCTIHSKEQQFVDQKVIYKHRTVQFPKLVTRDEWRKFEDHFSLLDPCTFCKGSPGKKCKKCYCIVCGDKGKEESQLMCDECDNAFHMSCLVPPLKEIPKNDWYCPSCVNVDAATIKRQKEARKLQLRKRGNSEEASSACLVPEGSFGKIPGILSGRLWATQAQLVSLGVHGSTEMSICGSAAGVQSICLTSSLKGHLDDKGHRFVLSGLSGTVNNLAMVQTLSAKFGARNWRMGSPIRVVRSDSLPTNFAPTRGFRYDGIYKVIRCSKGKDKTWELELVRDDNEPAPWTSEGKAFMRKMSIGFLEGQPEETPAKMMCLTDTVDKKEEIITPYILPRGVLKLITQDRLNARNWRVLEEAQKRGYPEFIKAVVEQFKCIICHEVCVNPVTMKCGHNKCLICMEKWLAGRKLANCLLCQEEVVGPFTPNTSLTKVLAFLLPG